ncbi:MAG: endonuclease III [Phycisphaerae bacterium]
MEGCAAGNRPAERIPDKKKRAKRILAVLRKLYPDAGCALRHTDPLQLLVATILSAQSTDETVNKVTPVLFGRYKTAKALASAPRARIEQIIHSTGFFRQKAKSVQGCCRTIVNDFDGEVPDNMEDLLTLPGVARKTANVVLGTAFGVNAGVVVDTHVGRLAERMALTWSAKDSKDAVKIERDLIELFPRRAWTFLGHSLIRHGRSVCRARKPACALCSLSRHCPSAFTFADNGRG